MRSTQSYAVNLSVLETARSVFARRRSQTRPNELFTVTDSVLGCSRSRFFKFSATQPECSSTTHYRRNRMQKPSLKQWSPSCIYFMTSCIKIFPQPLRILIPSSPELKAARPFAFSYGTLWNCKQTQTSRQQVFLHK